MNVTLIPESAPFTAEQRAWLNGFFAGMMGFQNQPSSPSEEPPAEPEDLPWHDAGLSMDERLALAEDKPIQHRLMAAMAQLDCGACGYHCQTYAEAIVSGEESNLTRCAPGGKETSRMLKLLLKDASSSGQTKASPTPKSSPTGPSSEHPAEVSVLTLHNLNKPGSAKQTTHVELDLSGTELEYRVGDSLGIYPTNCPELVNQILAEFRAEGDTSLTDALTRHRCLTDVTDELLDLLNATTTNGQAAAILKLKDDPERLDRMDVLDVLREFPLARPDPAAFVGTLTPLAPRLYSISSSPKAVPGQVHLTVGRVVTEVNGRTRKGVASTMFSDRLSPGDRVRAFVQPSHGFSVPANPNTSLIMVGPGTGIAPFRAFLQERQATLADGMNWLFFGDQHAATDFLYEEELQHYLDSGLLTRLDLAFSRDGDQKVYVQHRMLEAGAALFRWIEDGAVFCVCGDAKRMACDVDRALKAIVAEHGKMTEEQATEYVRELTKSGRYLRDVY